MAEKYKRHEQALRIFYKCLDELIAECQRLERRIIMFGSGTPANMAIYYLKIHDVIVEAILDNNPKNQGTKEYDTPIYSPETYLAEYDEKIRILIASSHENAMIRQLETLGFGGQHVVKLLDFQKAAADYSFADRMGYRELTSREIRSHQLRILHHLKELCDKHGLRYWLCGGTLLGAVRHQGFIPWDDDIDVFVEMKDLKKLAVLLKDDPDYGMATFVDKDMDFCDSCSYMYEMASDMDVNYFPIQISCGISIDIFPLVGIPAEDEERKQYIDEIKKRQQAVWNKMYSKKELREATTKLMEFMSRYDFDECRNCGYILSRHFTKEIWDTHCYQGTLEMTFEGESYRVPPKWEKYLEALYGKDYMTPPPETGRVSQHNYKAYMRENGGARWT